MVYDNQLDFQKMHSIYMPWYHKWVLSWYLSMMGIYEKKMSPIPIIQRISEVCAFTSLGKNFRWSIRWNSGYESFLLMQSVKLRSYSGSPSRKDLLEYMYDRPLLFKERLWQSKLSDRPRPLPNLQARFRDELWILENKQNQSFMTKNFVVH